ncbi:DUF2267 domain-containing protein [Baaleninema sp.]|uniref:DUF2267 domain-containing protein n=1 Tax=Baaleninema sp. TaxID=3101197 RepID=UPI003D088011
MTAATPAPFSQAVSDRAQLGDVYDARDLAEVVFRSMRDLMTTDAAKGVAEDLSSSQNADAEMVDLWKDTNPVTSGLSRVRRPLEYDGETFLFRVAQEGGLPKDKDVKTVVNAVFAALKARLSDSSIAAITEVMPGEVKQMWKSA